MPLTLDQIVDETTRWPDNLVAELVDRVLMARHGGIASAVEESWQAEIQRRVGDIQSGKVEGVPGDEVSAQIRKIVGR